MTIKNIKDKKNEKTLNNIRDKYCEVTGYDPKYEEALKEKDGFYKLAKKVIEMKDNETIDWNIDDGSSELGMGTTKKWLMDCDLIITVSYGGGLESILWLNDSITIDEVYEHFKKAYDGFKFVNFRK